ncbi:MAG: hypothetical protein CME64_01540 [Halobacteriovoraceae bacterium]|nr:hypothetical protein [Halobacteriovoraceae bacterium]|tara:strand:+ start:24550 stop:25749 length:1200 start_codon:yes stop_codon:yes gene_type:complete
MRIFRLIPILAMAIASNLFAADDLYTALLKRSDSLAQYLAQSRDRIIGVEFILASGTDEQIFSRFGHSLLRFVDNDADYTNDVVLSFEAKVTDANIDYMEGLSGGYETIARFDTLYNFWIRYVRLEDRPLERYIIPLTPRLRKNLIDKVLAYHSGDEALPNYTFLEQNCARVLSQLFIDAGLSSKDLTLGTRVPQYLNGWLNNSLLTPFKPIISLAPYTVFKKAADITDIALEDFRNYDLWTDKVVQKLREGLEQKELLFLFRELWDLPNDLGLALIKDKTYLHAKDLTHNDVVGMTIVPASMYQICEDYDCARQNILHEQRIWGIESSKVQAKTRIKKFVRNNFYKKRNRTSVVRELKRRKTPLGLTPLNSSLYHYYENLIDIKTDCKTNQSLEDCLN